jgi:hypothetical protein
MPTEFGIYYDVTECEITGDYTLQLTFNDGTQQTIDFRPVLLGPVFAPLRDLTLFNQVTLNPDTGTIEWPNGADFNPVILHDWPQYQDHILAERRQRHAISP